MNKITKIPAPAPFRWSCIARLVACQVGLLIGGMERLNAAGLFQPGFIEIDNPIQGNAGFIHFEDGDLQPPAIIALIFISMAQLLIPATSHSPWRLTLSVSKAFSLA
jgi:hypothetical protein